MLPRGPVSSCKAICFQTANLIFTASSGQCQFGQNRSPQLSGGAPSDKTLRVPRLLHPTPPLSAHTCPTFHSTAATPVADASHSKAHEPCKLVKARHLLHSSCTPPFARAWAPCFANKCSCHLTASLCAIGRQWHAKPSTRARPDNIVRAWK